MRKLALTIAAAVLFTAGAAQARPWLAWPHRQHHSRDLAELTYEATSALTERAGRRLSPAKPVVVTTIVSVDDLGRSSTLGREVSQLILDRLSQSQLLVKDVTYLRGLEVSPDGELALSREAAHLSRRIDAQAVVAGTYAVAGYTIYVNLRMLNAADGSLVSSVDFTIPLDENTAPLVRDAPHTIVPRDPEKVLFGERG